jgi:hypothetical protein
MQKRRHYHAKIKDRGPFKLPFNVCRERFGREMAAPQVTSAALLALALLYDPLYQTHTHHPCIRFTLISYRHT